MDYMIEKIRVARPEDGRAIYDLVCDMENKTLPYPDFEQIFQRQNAREDFLCLVYIQNEEVIGCINLRMEEQLHHAGKICEIMEFAVNREQRGNGIGKRLFDAACRKAREGQCLQIEVSCNRLRERTHRFYEAQGMHRFHYKFSLDFAGAGDCENRLGR